MKMKCTLWLTSTTSKKQTNKQTNEWNVMAHECHFHSRNKHWITF